jgi:murein L,D-transpeptidase YcbB/YkuD
MCSTAADEVGLSADDYRVEVPADGFDLTQSTERQKELMAFEMKLSLAVANYILDASRGRVDPNRISGYHDFKRKTRILASSLKRCPRRPIRMRRCWRTTRRGAFRGADRRTEAASGA